MTVLELLNAIAGGRTSFTRASHPDLEELDLMLEGFEVAGLILKAMRTIDYCRGGPRVARVDIIGELTVAGEAQRARLAGYAERSEAGSGGGEAARAGTVVSVRSLRHGVERTLKHQVETLQLLGKIASVGLVRRQLAGGDLLDGVTIALHSGFHL